MAELERESQGDFKNFLRMEPAAFHELVQRVTPSLIKQDTRFRRPLERGLRLVITLRHLASRPASKMSKPVYKEWPLVNKII